MSPQKGRPKSDNPKDVTVRARLDKETTEKLDKCAESLGVTRSDVIRQGINKIYDELKK